jgi:transposase
MALHLEEISLAVAPGAYALVLLDQARWHVSKKLPIPDNITLLPLPPKSPELKPVENTLCANDDETNTRATRRRPRTT